MNIFYCDPFAIPLPQDHRFPLEKYILLRKQLVAKGIVAPGHLHLAPAATRDDILRVHAPEYVRKLERGALSAKEMRRVGFPWSPELVIRSRHSAGATIQACTSAIADGLACSLSGGTHHAFADRGEGYCILNDSVIAARAMQLRMGITKILVFDCDVHQGNGTADLAAGDPTLVTISIHGKNNFPYRKVKSDLDVELDDGTGDARYLEALRMVLDCAMQMDSFELVIYLAGADPHYNDRFGRLALTKSGLAQRDRLVLQRFIDARIPVAITMAGGYGRRMQDTVDIHIQTIRMAMGLYRLNARSAL